MRLVIGISAVWQLHWQRQLASNADDLCPAARVHQLRRQPRHILSAERPLQGAPQEDGCRGEVVWSRRCDARAPARESAAFTETEATAKQKHSHVDQLSTNHSCHGQPRPASVMDAHISAVCTENQWRRLHRARGTCTHFYKWLGTRGTVSRRTANKKLTKFYWPSGKRSPKRPIIVVVEPKKWRGTNRTCVPKFQICFDAAAPNVSVFLHFRRGRKGCLSQDEFTRAPAQLLWWTTFTDKW